MAGQMAMNAILDSEGEDYDDYLRKRRPKSMQERNDFFSELDDQEFVLRFRLDKESALEILDQIEVNLEFDTDK